MNVFTRSRGMAVEGHRERENPPGGLMEELERGVWEALRLWDSDVALPVCLLTGQVYYGGEWVDVVGFLRDRIAKPVIGKFSDQALLDLVDREMSLYRQHVLVG